IGGISYEKLADFIKTLRPDLSICPATILAIVDGIGKKLETPRKKIQTKVQNSPYVQADETGMRQDGKNGYVWVFCNPNYALYEYDPSRARTVAERVLGKDYGGWVVSDGYNVYEIFQQQRCWSHILREGDAIAKECPEAELQAQRLHDIYKIADAAKREPPDKRSEIIEKLSGQTGLGHIIEILRVTKGCKKFSGTLQRALPHLFVGVKNPEVPLHNNFGERTIRPIVIHRKMMGCIRNDKGRRFINNTMSMVQTWKLQGQNVHKNLLMYAN
ncbi:IS66 family transposase, partial [Candidatus Woesearchaeota archaeon]|nr:IS66 family transposase [Candidatus Woesearchaeota archaeon]